MVRGIRGATCIAQNSAAAIIDGSLELLQEIIAQNNIKKDQIVCVYFTATPDLDEEFPARALRQCGLEFIPSLCSVEIDVKGSLEKVIRILMLIEGRMIEAKVKHIYLGDARRLRPDLCP